MSVTNSVLELFCFDKETTEILIDAATFTHLGAMAAGLGAVIFADTTILKRVTRPTTPSQIAVIDHAHGVISIALVFLWLSGLALVGLKAGFQPANVSPKLIAKLGTVSVLSLTAITMARFALPYLRENVGQRLIDASLVEQCQLALCVGMSAAGWGTALLLGSSNILKVGGNEVMTIAAGMHGLAAAGALAMAVSVYALQRNGDRPGMDDALPS